MAIALPSHCCWPWSSFIVCCVFSLLYLFYCFSMAQQLSYISMTPDRSRSRDDPPMWGHPHPERPHDPAHQRPWNYTPALRWTRRVLIIIDLDPIRNLMTERFSGVMQATTCEHLPNLSQSEEMALFTYSFLLTPGQIQITSIENILFYISQPAYQQHLGNISWTNLHRSSMEWLHWRYFCSSPSTNHHPPSTWTSPTLDWGPRSRYLQSISWLH